MQRRIAASTAAPPGFAAAQGRCHETSLLCSHTPPQFSMLSAPCSGLLRLPAQHNQWVAAVAFGREVGREGWCCGTCAHPACVMEHACRPLTPCQLSWHPRHMLHSLHHGCNGAPLAACDGRQTEAAGGLIFRALPAQSAQALCRTMHCCPPALLSCLPALTVMAAFPTTATPCPSGRGGGDGGRGAGRAAEAPHTQLLHRPLAA